MKNEHITLQVSATGLSPLQTLKHNGNRKINIANVHKLRIYAVRLSLDVELDIIRTIEQSKMCHIS